jgi:glycine/D-amino acid oxidase-like deaminating enzyme
MRPLTADSLPMVGPMKHYPNVVLNCGYGYMGFQSFGVSKIIEGIIEDNDAGKDLFPQKVIRANLVSRVGI